MNKETNCEICGEPIDRTSCDQTYSILTIIRDTDATGTKEERVYLCEEDTARVEVFINENALEHGR